MTALVDVLAAHSPGAFGPGDTACRCDQTWRKHSDHTTHVAAAVTTWLASELAGAGMREVVARTLADDEALARHDLPYSDISWACVRGEFQGRAAAALSAVAARLGGGS